MSNTMFDARELLVPGSVYDRGRTTVELLHITVFLSHPFLFFFFFSFSFST